MPLQATSGAASYDAFGGGVPVVPNYIEEVFSTYLYTGNGSTQTITNGIDLSTKGGLVWIKDRTQTWDNLLVDSARGNGNALFSNTTAASTAGFGVDLASNGFNLTSGDNISNKIRPYASWTFRKAPKFFDVVTYTGTGSPRTISHNLGSVPGCIIVKRTNASGSWRVYHRSLTSAAYMVELNTSSGEALDNASWNSTAPTSSVFTVGSDAFVNASGGTYVAYVFAHNAGGFGLLGTDNVISCGSFTTNGSGVASVNLGYEPQWVVTKAIAGGTGDWFMQDNMRGFTASPTVYTANPLLRANTSDSDATYGGPTLQANSTGFTTASATYDPSVTYIYIAIRRGPMKVPTSGTEVYATDTAGGTAPNPPLYNSGWPVDLGWYRGNMPNAASNDWYDRLRGQTQTLFTNSTSKEEAFGGGNYSFDSNTGWSTQNFVQSDYRAWMFRRAPSFFDEVCYTGTGASSQVLTHNLTVTPQLTIFKKRSASNPWDVVSGNTSYLQLNENFAASPDTSIAATATTITAPLGAGNGLNASGATYVAYLFATCAGVSKVFSYTGNGSSQTINCGFTGGARFVLIKRTDSTGDWYVWDSARGIVSGNDPHLSLNSIAAEVTTDDTIDTDSTGFVVNQVSATNVNVSSATYIGLAIA